MTRTGRAVRAMPWRPGLAILLVAGLCLPAGRACADARFAGTHAASFLAMTPGVASMSMGGSGLAFGTGIEAASLNAAALAWVDQAQIALAHVDLPLQATQEWAAVGGRFGASRTRWSLQAVMRDEGLFEGRDRTGAYTGALDVGSMAIGLGAARPFGRHVALGGGMRWVGETLGDVRGSGIAFDAGAQLRAGDFSLGLAAQNVGGGMRYEGLQWRMPWDFGGGIAYAHAGSGLRLAVDVHVPATYWTDVRTGVEWRWSDRVALRAGWRVEPGAPANEARGGPAFGAGFKAGGTWADYAFRSGDDGSAEHRFGLSFGWSRSPSADASLPRAAGPTPEGATPR